MGKYLHLFLGDSAKTEHDELYESGYTAPWAAFVENYGMTYNKKEVGPKQAWFSPCDVSPEITDWLQIEKIEYDVFPPREEGRYQIIFGRNDALYWHEKAGGWYYDVYNDSTGDYDTIEITSLEQLNQIITESSIMDFIKEEDAIDPESEPCWDCVGGEYCYLYRVYPMEGYVPPVTAKKLGEMTTDDWNSLYSSNLENFFVRSVEDEIDFFNSFLTGGTKYIDFYLTGELGLQTMTSLFEWNGNEELLCYYDDFEKQGKPVIIRSFGDFIRDSIYDNEGLILYIDNMTQQQIKQVIENNYKLIWETPTGEVEGDKL